MLDVDGEEAKTLYCEAVNNTHIDYLFETPSLHSYVCTTSCGHIVSSAACNLQQLLIVSSNITVDYPSCAL